MTQSVTADEAIGCLELLQLPPTNPAAIRQWARRGHVRTYGLNSSNQMRYNLDDIIERVKA